MKAKVVGYWVCTGLIAFFMLSGGVFQMMRAPNVIEGIHDHLGYPIHFIVLLGVWKVLGGIALLAPGFPLIKEWAYAGIFIDLTGASVAGASNGDSLFHIVMPLLITGILVGSWWLRPESRRLRPA